MTVLSARAGIAAAAVLAVLHVASVNAVSVAPPARLALEVGSSFYLVRNTSEPPFVAPAGARPLCVLARINGECYTLKQPGYVQGRKGPGDFFLKVRACGNFDIMIMTGCPVVPFALCLPLHASWDVLCLVIVIFGCRSRLVI